MFSLKTTPEASRPCLFSGLLTLDCDSVLCSTWRVKSTSRRPQRDRRPGEVHLLFQGRRVDARDERTRHRLARNGRWRKSREQQCGRPQRSHPFDSTRRPRANSRFACCWRRAAPEQLRDTAPAVHRIFVDARAQVMEETLGNLSAFYAMFPGNHKFNVFPLWLAEDHHARLSSVFAPSIGHPHSEDLDAEYLNIFETRTRTPFFQDVYVDGVRVMLIIGPTGTGKSVHGNADRLRWSRSTADSPTSSTSAAAMRVLSSCMAARLTGSAKTARVSTHLPWSRPKAISSFCTPSSSCC